MKAFLALSAAVSVLAFAPAAHAATFLPGSSNFTVTGNGESGTEVVSAFFGNSGLSSNTGSDSFLFRIGPETDDSTIIGLGSGSITTSFTNASDRLSFRSVTFNNGFTTFNVPIVATGSNGFAGSLGNIPIFSGVLNSLTVNYNAGQNASYSGTLTFTPTAPIPEPATWLMMILGFAAIGFSMRRKKEEEARVRFAF